MEEEIKRSLILIGTVKSVKEIMEEIIEQYGGKMTLLEYLNKMGKDRVVLA